ncbi:MAG: nucleoside triphosphate pyrophosphohydrolase family protein [Planctomycetota bacterium]|jgi:hypothetical protein
MTDPEKREPLDFRAIWERQLAFNRRFFADSGVDLGRLSDHELADWSKEFILHVEDELHELLRETSWKMHLRDDTSPAVRSKVLEEWTDAFKFLLGLAQIWGFTPEEAAEEFRRKSKLVEARWEHRRGAP